MLCSKLKYSPILSATLSQIHSILLILSLFIFINLQISVGNALINSFQLLSSSQNKLVCSFILDTTVVFILIFVETKFAISWDVSSHTKGIQSQNINSDIFGFFDLLIESSKFLAFFSLNDGRVNKSQNLKVNRSAKSSIRLFSDNKIITLSQQPSIFKAFLEQK